MVVGYTYGHGGVSGPPPPATSPCPAQALPGLKALAWAPHPWTRDAQTQDTQTRNTQPRYTREPKGQNRQNRQWSQKCQN